MAERFITCDYRYLDRYFSRRNRGIHLTGLPGRAAAVLIVLWLFAMFRGDLVSSFYQEDHEIVWSLPGEEERGETWHIKMNLRQGELVITHDYVTERR